MRANNVVPIARKEAKSLVDWVKLLAKMDERGRTVLSRLDGLCARRFNRDGKHDDVFEDARNYLFDELTRDNWRRCASFAGKAPPDAYLLTIARTILEDYARKQWGRYRPPVSIQKLGKFFVRAHKMLRCEMRPPQDCIETLVFLGADKQLAENAVRICQQEISRSASAHRRGSDGMALDWYEHHTSGHSDAFETLQVEERDQQLEIAKALLEATDSTNVHKLGDLEIEPRLRFALREVYSEGVPLSQVARELDVNYYALRRQLNACLDQIRTALLESQRT